MGLLRRQHNHKSRVSTVMAAGTTLTGDLVLEDGLFTNGAVEGRIVSSGDVYLGPSAQAEGRIDATDVFISGVFRGQIRCRSLKVTESGEVYGTVASDKMVIEPGGKLMGDSLARDDLPPVQLDDTAPAPFPRSTPRRAGHGQPAHPAPPAPVDGAGSPAGAVTPVGISPSAADLEAVSSQCPTETDAEMEQILHECINKADRHENVGHGAEEVLEEEADSKAEPWSVFDISPRYR